MAAQGLACCCRNRGGQPLAGGVLEVRLGVCRGGGEAVIPGGRACHGVGRLDGTMNRVLGEPRVGVWFMPCTWKVLGWR